ncbi:MAG: hypothetical protein KAI94_07915, partial [Anaerolineales bacterium]|nr:hypothetical protein [Anaerolineales bacterium]
RMVGNYVYGLGEGLVSGEAEPYTFTLSRPRGKYDGPRELKRYARRLTKLAKRLEVDLGGPQDIEWAIADGKLFLLQSRPVTTLIGHNPATGEWNDTQTGDFLWSNTNLMEAVPDVMTPLTYSIWQIFHTKTAFYSGRFPGVGNICGRPYVNISLLVSFYQALGKSRQEALQQMMGTIGKIPEDMQISLIPIRRLPFLLNFVPSILKRLRLANQILKEMPEYITSSADACERYRRRVQQVESKEQLLTLWQTELEPYFLKSCWMLRVSARKSIGLSTKLTSELTELVGEADANALLLHVGREGSHQEVSDLLESLGPVVSLARLAHGEISREAYLKRYGHRGPHECELSSPSPAEDSEWLDKQLAEYSESPFDVEAMLAQQKDEFSATWARFQESYPKKWRSMERSLEVAAEEARRREAVRSEITRFIGVIRAFALRAGELTGLDQGIFFLYLEEMLDVLSGDGAMVKYIPARRETHAGYSALPPYPALINGRFDPFEWASDPERRSDYYDSRTPLPPPDSDSISGFAGAAGRVEGRVRRLDSAEEGDKLRAGEILVTVTTNVGWTPLFPRAAAIVTDVGAPLSHAAIVARELGIPAVVGCGNATMRLQTGDLVLVDGGKGVVEILEKS